MDKNLDSNLDLGKSSLVWYPKSDKVNKIKKIKAINCNSLTYEFVCAYSNNYKKKHTDFNTARSAIINLFIPHI